MKAQVKKVEVRQVRVSKKFDRLEDMIRAMNHKQGQGYIVKPCLTKDGRYCFQYILRIV